MSYLTRDEHEGIRDYAILLPIALTGNSGYEEKYTIIFSDWKVISMNKTIDLPTMMSLTYD